MAGGKLLPPKILHSKAPHPTLVAPQNGTTLFKPHQGIPGMAAASIYTNGLQHVRIVGGTLLRNGVQLAATGTTEPADMYRALGCSYAKFFKMDSLCKWAWLGAEALLRQGESWLYDGLDKQHIAVVIATRDGCLETDHRYAETMQTIPSPAVFVYTLPNIALGEICIRHGFTGEQLCEVADDFDAEALLFWVRDLLEHRGANHCLFGWADAVGAHHDVSLFWADRQSIESLSVQQLQALHITTLPAAR